MYVPTLSLSIKGRPDRAPPHPPPGGGGDGPLGPGRRRLPQLLLLRRPPPPHLRHVPRRVGLGERRHAGGLRHQAQGLRGVRKGPVAS